MLCLCWSKETGKRRANPLRKGKRKPWERKETGARKLINIYQPTNCLAAISCPPFRQMSTLRTELVLLIKHIPEENLGQLCQSEHIFLFAEMVMCHENSKNSKPVQLFAECSFNSAGLATYNYLLISKQTKLKSKELERETPVFCTCRH